MIWPTSYGPRRGQIIAQLVDFGENLWDYIGFREICGTNRGRTRKSHNFFSFYPKLDEKEAK